MAQQIVDIDPTKPLGDSVQALKLTPRALILLLGEFDPALSGQVRSICSRALAPIALDPGALIVDDGSSGCAGLLGQAAADQDQMAQLLAVVPHDRPPDSIDINHEFVLRLPSSWSDPIKYTFQIADCLTEQGAHPKPALVILFGGATPETKAVIRAARRGWPVLVLNGTGGLAKSIADAKTPQADGTLPPPPPDPDLREILETGNVYLSSLDASVDELNRVILGRIETRSETAEATLAGAWHRFDNVDLGARAKQARFRKIELTLIILAVMAALFAILMTKPLRADWQKYLPDTPLHILVIVVPILISIIAAYNSHFRDGSQWILLRGAAEAMKREIFRFRAQAGVYSDEQCVQSSRESKLASRIKDITSALEQSAVNKGNLDQQPPGDPQRATFIGPDEYVQARLRDQANYFVDKTRRLSKQLTLMQLLIYVVGGLGTFLAAIKMDVWVALSTALVTALTTKLQADQVETSLVQYNQALVSLKNIETWWTGLSSWEKKRRSNIDLLVDQTEKALESETAGWVQQMQSSLDKLTEKEKPPAKTTAPSG
jgi:hypothetical protein